MPFKIIQYNTRVAEVQFICDSCGKLIRTSLISEAEVKELKNKRIVCWSCKQSPANKN